MPLYATLVVAAALFALSIGVQVRADRKGPLKPPVITAPAWVPWVCLAVLWAVFGTLAVVVEDTEVRVTMIGFGVLMTIMVLFGTWRTRRLRRQEAAVRPPAAGTGPA